MERILQAIQSELSDEELVAITTELVKNARRAVATDSAASVLLSDAEAVLAIVSQRIGGKKDQEVNLVI